MSPTKSNHVPIRNDELIILRGPKSFDPGRLAHAIGPFGFEAFVCTRLAAVRHELKQLVLEKGVSYVWRLAHLQEAVLPAGPTQRRGLLAMLALMIARLAPIREFVVVDAYLLPKKMTPDYLPEMISLLEPIARAVAKLTLVTSKKYDPKLLMDLQTTLAASYPNCSLIHKVSARYHDRFWIADLERGLFVGTSPNGIGLRYSLADYLEKSDVDGIVEDLKGQGVL